LISRKRKALLRCGVKKQGFEAEKQDYFGEQNVRFRVIGKVQ
jgi:hypothetical protein